MNLINHRASALVAVKALILTGLLLLGGENRAASQTIALDTICWISTAAESSETVGTYFTVLTPITVTELDALSVVLRPLTSEPVRIGLWNSAGALVTQADVSTSAPEVVTNSASGNLFFGTSVTPITLNPGQYVIGALIAKSENTIYTPFDDVVLDPAISFDGYALTKSDTLVRPDFQTSEYTFFGPSFKFEQSVPEPGIVTLVSVGGIIGALLLIRRKSTNP